MIGMPQTDMQVQSFEVEVLGHPGATVRECVYVCGDAGAFLEGWHAELRAYLHVVVALPRGCGWKHTQAHTHTHTHTHTDAHTYTRTHVRRGEGGWVGMPQWCPCMHIPTYRHVPTYLAPPPETSPVGRSAYVHTRIHLLVHRRRVGGQHGHEHVTPYV
jgi:hypothetical protein